MVPKGTNVLGKGHLVAVWAVGTRHLLSAGCLAGSVFQLCVGVAPLHGCSGQNEEAASADNWVEGDVYTLEESPRQ
jgi:hypothetical protein